MNAKGRLRKTGPLISTSKNLLEEAELSRIFTCKTKKSFSQASPTHKENA